MPHPQRTPVAFSIEQKAAQQKKLYRGAVGEALTCYYGTTTSSILLLILE